MELNCRPLARTDLEKVQAFADAEIGVGYFQAAELEEIYRRSLKDDVMYSLVLEGPGAEILGIRISYPPGRWERGKGRDLNPTAWPHSMGETGYFQSIFIAASLRGQDWGGRMSRRALEILRTGGAKGVVCHSWKESPDNSSTRYLQKLGFVALAEFPLYWKDIDYHCTRCLKPPCQCTAIEMYLDLEKS